MIFTQTQTNIEKLKMKLTKLCKNNKTLIKDRGDFSNFSAVVMEKCKYFIPKKLGKMNKSDNQKMKDFISSIDACFNRFSFGRFGILPCATTLKRYLRTPAM